MKAAVFALFAGMVGYAFALRAPEANAAAEKVLYSFCSQANCVDGALPVANVIDVKGTLYGTTFLGGANCNGNCGTVFSLDPKTGLETVLYSFCNQQNCTDGAYPEAGLIDVTGILYGTTTYGGRTPCASGCGTVFLLDPNTGTEKVLHTFRSQLHPADGAHPNANLIELNGTLYGTTFSGGINCTNQAIPDCGTVFSLDPKSGLETVLYSFCDQQNCTDGAYPEAGLIARGGKLFGTTTGGGSANCQYGCGTVFSLDPITGAEKVLYSFCSQANCTDGANPRATLIDVNGKLYGTTEFGGNDCEPTFNPPTCGTVYALDPSTGVETVLYSFCNQQNCTDGLYPEAGVIYVKGTLYGTTIQGGANCTGNSAPGCGTVFALDPDTGVETVLYSFSSQQNGIDGENPEAGLIDVGNTLYGTTSNGGVYYSGTVFAIPIPAMSTR